MQNICPACQQPNSSTSYQCHNCGAALRMRSQISFDQETHPQRLDRLPKSKVKNGKALNNNPIIVSHDQNVSVAGHNITSRQLKQIGASVAVSVLALLAEMSLIYLRRRLDRMRLTPMSRTPSKKISPRNKSGELVTTKTREEPGEVVTIVRERVVEIRRWGRPMQRVIERVAWRSEPKK